MLARTTFEVRQIAELLGKLPAFGSATEIWAQRTFRPRDMHIEKTFWELDVTAGLLSRGALVLTYVETQR